MGREDAQGTTGAEIGIGVGKSTAGVPGPLPRFLSAEILSGIAEPAREDATVE